MLHVSHCRVRGFLKGFSICWSNWLPKLPLAIEFHLGNVMKWCPLLNDRTSAGSTGLRHENARSPAERITDCPYPWSANAMKFIEYASASYFIWKCTTSIIAHYTHLPTTHFSVSSAMDDLLSFCILFNKTSFWQKSMAKDCNWCYAYGESLKAKITVLNLMWAASPNSVSKPFLSYLQPQMQTFRCQHSRLKISSHVYSIMDGRLNVMCG